MALKHVKKYYKEIEDLYFGLVEMARDFDEELRNGKVTEEMFQQAQMMVNRAKENYERLTYIMYLFFQPNRNSKTKDYNRQTGDAFKVLNEKRADQESVVNEMNDVLSGFKQLLKEIKYNDTK